MGLNLIDIVIWWLALELIGISALPIALYVGRNLKDGGYSISKPLGLLLLTYFTWIISYLSGYSLTPILLSSGITIALSLVFYFKNKPLKLPDKKYVLKFEMLFFLAFVIFSVIRAYSPDIYWTGGEKFMDMTFINSLLRTQQFPPSDPWMSGTVLQYYYFGYLIVSNLIKLTGVFPSIAFNLATASFFAISLTTAFGIGYNLTEKIKYGLVTAFFVAVAGNLVGFFQLMDIIMKEGVLNNILIFNYWTSSRVIPNTVNEFPFFTFMQGDVHAHMFSITFQLLIILLLLNIFKSGIKVISLFILGLSVGFLYPLNTWDYPVYLFLAIFVIAAGVFMSQGFNLSNLMKTDLLKLASIVPLALLSYLLYLPYHLSYKLERAISIVPPGSRTSIVFYFAIYGLFLFLIFRFAFSGFRKYKLKPKYLIIPFFVLLMLSIALKFDLLLLLIPILFLSLMSLLKEKDKNHAFVYLLLITGILISLFCELFYIKDALGTANPDYIRFNTVFKFYMQNWILWGISAGAILFHFRGSFTNRKSWGMIALILIIMVSVYPIFATIGKSGGFVGEPTLNGESYIQKEHPEDYMAILWFRNISGQPVVLQAPGEPYQWNTYITAFTGLPTVIGWGGHEITWRQNSSEINKRWSDAGTIYSSSNKYEVDALLKRYNISYIYFGEAEGKKYSPRLFESNHDRFVKVFEYGDVVVFETGIND